MQFIAEGEYNFLNFLWYENDRNFRTKPILCPKVVKFIFFSQHLRMIGHHFQGAQADAGQSPFYDI